MRATFLCCAGLTACLVACGDAQSEPEAFRPASDPSGAGDVGNSDDADDPRGSVEADAGPGVCETLEVVARPEYPKILIVLDRSGSMAGEPWDHATEAIDALLTSYPDALFGLAMYPSVGEELSCMAGDVLVDAAAGTHTQVRDLLLADTSRAIEDTGYTPTAATLARARTALAPRPDDLHERIVLLVTDGQPNCNAEGPEKHSADVPATLSAIDGLLADSVKTFVVGYRTEKHANVMDDMASHGGTGKHYAVDDTQTLLTAFRDVAISVAPCSFELDAPPPGPEFVRVLLDGVDLSLDAAGFAIDDQTKIRLLGASCEVMRDGKPHTVEVLVECEPVRLI